MRARDQPSEAWPEFGNLSLESDTISSFSLPCAERRWPSLHKCAELGCARADWKASSRAPLDTPAAGRLAPLVSWGELVACPLHG